jgi:hypothetical protein
MRKFIVSVIALAVLGLSAPIAMSTSADARHYRGHKKVVIIKKHRDRGHHYGWYKHKRHHHHHHSHSGATVVIR